MKGMREAMAILDDFREKYGELAEYFEEKGWPSPLLVIGALLVLLLAASYLLFLQPQKQSVSISLKDSNGNNLAGLRVQLFDGDKQVGEKVSGDDGRAFFQDAPKSGKLRVKVTDPKDAFPETSQSVSGGETVIRLQASEPPETTTEYVTVSVADSSGRAVSSASVVMRFDDGTEQQSVTAFDGLASFALSEIPPHVTIVTTAYGFKTLTSSYFGSEIRERGGTIILQLQSNAEQDNADRDGDNSQPSYGSVLVSVSSSQDGSPVRNAQVALLDASTLRPFKNLRTDDLGIALFENVKIGRAFIAQVSETSKFVGASAEEQAVYSAEEPLDLPIFLDEKRQGIYLAFRIVSESDTAVEGAEVVVYDAKGKPADRQLSDGEGMASFTVAKDREYYATAYSDGYLPASGMFSPSMDAQKVRLVPATSENTALITVEAEDDVGPADRADVLLYNEDGFPLGLPSEYARADGRAEFGAPLEIDGRPYSLYAKASRYDKSGESARVEAGDGVVLSVFLDYAPAVLEVALVDAGTGEPLANGSVSVVGSGGEILAACEYEGVNCTFKVQAMQELRVIASAEEYHQTSSAVMTFDASERRSVTLQLVSLSDARSVSAKFLGLWNAQGEVKEVGNADYYTAKFLLTSPSIAKNVGLHVHVAGGGFAYFPEAPSIEGVLFSSSEYSEGSCYATTANSSGLRSIDVVYPKGFAGSKEIALKLYIAPDAPASSAFSFNYKGYAVRDGVLALSPELESYDDVYLPATTEGLVRSMCQYKDSVSQVKVTASPLVCDERALFCRKLYLKSGSTVSKSSIEVAKGAEFSLVYDVLSQEAIDSIGIRTAHSEFTGSSSMDFASDEGDGGSAETVASEQRLPVNIEAGKRTGGALSFKAAKASLSSVLQVTFYSENDQRKFDFNIRITGTNAFKRSITPERVEAGKAAKAKVRLLDEGNNPVEDALVTLFDCEGAPLNAEEPQLQGDGSPESGALGSYSLPFTAITLGRIGVRLEHKDYKSSESCSIEVTPPEDSLEASPESIEFKGKSDNLDIKTVTFSSSLDTPSRLDLYSICLSNNVPVLTVIPVSFSSFADSASADVEVIPNTTARTSCQIVATQRISSKYTLTAAVGVRIDVKSPTVDEIEHPSVTPSPTPTPSSRPPIPSVVYLTLDAYGSAEAYYSLPMPGAIDSCTLKGSDVFTGGTSVECESGVIHLIADYASLAQTQGIRETGRLSVKTDDGLTHLFTVIVYRRGVPTPTPTNTPTPSPTPTITPGQCARKSCPRGGTSLQCCDDDYSADFSRAECNSRRAYAYFVEGASLDDACSMAVPSCVLSADPQVVSAAGDVQISATYNDLDFAPNTISVSCGNGRTVNLVPCQETTGSCTQACYYSEPGVYEAVATAGETECMSVQVEFLSGSGGATPTPTPSPTATVGPNPNIQSPVYLYLDSNGFAQEARSFPQADISSCELQGPDDLLNYVIADCNGKTILLSADYSGSKVSKDFRVRGTLAVAAGDIAKSYSIMVSAANFDSGQDPSVDTSLPPLPDRIEFNVDERNTFFDPLYTLGGLGELATSCAIRGLDSSFNAWVSTQYCSEADQRLQVLGDFSGATYRQLLRMVYANNPQCAGYYGAPQMSYDPYMRQPYDNFGGYSPQPYGYGYADQTALPGYNPPSQYYQYNPNSAYPEQGFYDRYYNYPPQLQYYNQNTAGRQFSAQFSTTLPSYCVPTPLSGNVVVTLKSGTTRRIPLIITATGANYGQMPLPQPIPQPQQQAGSYIKSPLTVTIDPYTLSRWALLQEDYEGTESPQCAIRSDAALYKRVDEGLMQQNQYPNSPYSNQPNYPNYWNTQGSRGSTGLSGSVSAKNIVSESSFERKQLCSPSQGLLKHEFGVKLSSVTARELTPGNPLNAPQEAFIEERYFRTQNVQLTPITVVVGDKDEFKYEPIDGPLQFIVTGGSPSVGGDAGEFKLVYDIFDGDNCQISGVKDASASVGDIAGQPSLATLEASLETGDYALNNDGFYRTARVENPVKLAVPPKSAYVRCGTRKGGVSSKLSFASFADVNNAEAPDGVLKDYAVPMVFESSFAKLSSGKRYECIASSSGSPTIVSLVENAIGNEPDPAKAYEAYGCKVDTASGRLVVNLDYGKLATKAGKPALESFEDQVTLSVAVVTQSPASSLKSNKAYEIRRELGSVRLTVTRKPAEEKSGQDYLSLTFKSGFASDTDSPAPITVNGDGSYGNKPLVIVAEKGILTFSPTFAKDDAEIAKYRFAAVARIGIEKFKEISAIKDPYEQACQICKTLVLFRYDPQDKEIHLRNGQELSWDFQNPAQWSLEGKALPLQQEALTQGEQLVIGIAYSQEAKSGKTVGVILQFVRASDLIEGEVPEALTEVIRYDAAEKAWYTTDKALNSGQKVWPAGKDVPGGPGKTPATEKCPAGVDVEKPTGTPEAACKQFESPIEASYKNGVLSLKLSPASGADMKDLLAKVYLNAKIRLGASVDLYPQGSPVSLSWAQCESGKICLDLPGSSILYDESTGKCGGTLKEFVESEIKKNTPSLSLTLKVEKKFDAEKIRRVVGTCPAVLKLPHTEVGPIVGVRVGDGIYTFDVSAERSTAVFSNGYGLRLEQIIKSGPAITGIKLSASCGSRTGQKTLSVGSVDDFLPERQKTWEYDGALRVTWTAANNNAGTVALKMDSIGSTKCLDGSSPAEPVSDEKTGDGDYSVKIDDILTLNNGLKIRVDDLSFFNTWVFFHPGMRYTVLSKDGKTPLNEGSVADNWGYKEQLWKWEDGTRVRVRWLSGLPNNNRAWIRISSS
ncbi:MAG: hypothetical protein V1787_01520 [Candidatus Micrarchaeota archaeon]